MSSGSIARRRWTDPSTTEANEIDTLLGPPALLPGEKADAYAGLLRRVRGAVNPADVIEELWIRDFVDLMWETLRLRRLKAKLLASSAHKGVRSILEPIVGSIEGHKLGDAWSSGNARAIKAVDKHLDDASLDREAITAQTLSLEIDSVERIDRMLAAAEMRRTVMLRELDRHRVVVAQRLRAVSSEIEDAEYEEIEESGTGPHEQRRAKGG